MGQRWGIIGGREGGLIGVGFLTNYPGLPRIAQDYSGLPKLELEITMMMLLCAIFSEWVWTWWLHRVDLRAETIWDHLTIWETIQPSGLSRPQSTIVSKAIYSPEVWWEKILGRCCSSWKVMRYSMENVRPSASMRLRGIWFDYTNISPPCPSNSDLHLHKFFYIVKKVWMLFQSGSLFFLYCT